MATWESAWLATAAETQSVDSSGRVTRTGRSTDFLANTHGKLRLVARNGAGEWILHEGGAIMVGRRPDQDLVLARKAVSGKHAALLSSSDPNGVRFYLHDWSSKGSYVNGSRCFGQRRVLREGDVIHFGDKHFSTRLDIVEIRPINSALPPSILQEESTLIDPQTRTTGSELGEKQVPDGVIQTEPSRARRSRARDRARGRLHPAKADEDTDRKDEEARRHRHDPDGEGDHDAAHAGDAVAAELEKRQRRTTAVYSRGTLGVRGSENRQTQVPSCLSNSSSGV